MRWIGTAVFVLAAASAPAQDRPWAFRPPEPVEPPRAGHPVDAFLQARLEERGVRAAPPAERITLLRRVTFDLIGLPPTPEEADAFLRDDAADAFEKVVDRLLADPRYGERWARHWLDLARYAESDGFENDKVRPHAWRYRDVVIRALNDDKPYDRFVLEQIAGDELFPGDPDALTAAGFARLCAWDEICKNEPQRWQDFLNDATDTIGSVFLGLTIGCARCHDHKYDPITQGDYYGIQAFLAAVKREVRPLPGDPRDPDEVRARFAEASAALERAKAERHELWEKHRALVKAGKDAEAKVKDDEILKSVQTVAEDKERLAAADAAIKQWQPEVELYRPAAEVLVERGREAPKVHLLKRGEMSAPGREVSPAFPKALAGETAPAIEPPADAPGTGRRSALARWLADPANPLTARVIVNRVWAQHFGRGIVATPSDFGRNGRPASHPELLDWLARQFVRDGWRLKSLHRLILTSAAYRRSTRFDAGAARVDPENALLWRMNRRRLEGEALRDGVLFVSGRLNPRRGGPGVYAPISPEIMIDLPNNDKLPSWGTLADEAEGRRRTIYVFQRRSLMYPIVEAFDGADMNLTCPQRAVTNVAPQALALFNGAFTRQEAAALAERVAREAGDDPEARLERVYRLALTRAPAPAEREDARAFLREQAARRADAGPAEAARLAFVDLCHVIFNTNEFIYVD
jgi:hypothetical protein